MGAGQPATALSGRNPGLETLEEPSGARRWWEKEKFKRDQIVIFTQSFHRYLQPLSTSSTSDSFDTEELRDGVANLHPRSNFRILEFFSSCEKAATPVYLAVAEREHKHFGILEDKSDDAILGAHTNDPLRKQDTVLNRKNFAP